MNFELLGDGEILGVSNGDINDTTSFINTSSRKTKKGKCLVIVKAGDKKGTLKLEVNAKNLKRQIFNTKH